MESKMNEAGGKPLRIAVLGSGNGSNCQAIIDAIENGKLNARIVCVLSDVKEAFILERARKHGIPGEYVSAEPFKTKLDGEGEKKYIDTLKRHGTEIIALAGFMRVVKKGLLQAFPGKIINIHPSLLPAFPGLEAWKQALDYGVKVTGCTVHIVEEGVDTGPVIIQKSVPVQDNDTPESLHERILEQEHIAYPEAINIIVSGRFRRVGRRLIMEGSKK